MTECSFGPSGRAVLLAAHPGPELRIVVDDGERVPGVAAVVGAEQPLRRGASVPCLRFVRVARREPEGVIDHSPRQFSIGAFRRLGESGRPRGFLPGVAEIRGAKDGRAEMAGLHRRQQRASVARVEHEVINDLAEKVRPVDAPFLAIRVAMKQPRALARGDQHYHPTRWSRGRFGTDGGFILSGW